MLYRKLGNTRDVSVLGFGCMRLPLKQGLEKASDVFDGTKPIDEDQATAMIHHAIEQGVNYFDTAYPYHGGQSEAFLGKALSGYRDRVMVATKSPIWLVQTAADFDRFLDEQLGKLKTHYVDFYLLHSLGRQSWQR
ncbi:MAG: Aldo/keto reductase, partial [Deltaproteobacteria bacterium]|nr:Aldo/keto reductase [Deltaproteobacteria bacterium]